MGYDIFLSFKTSDQEEVERVAASLSAAGLQIFFSPLSIQGGENWLEAVEAGLAASRHCAVCLGKEGLGQWQKLERELAHVRQQREPSFRVIPVLLSGFQDSDLPLTFLDLNSRVDLRGDRESGLKDLLRAVLGTATAEIVTGALEAEICPYRDLLPYREEDSPAYPSFGQEELLTLLESLIRVQPFTVLMGPSGSGKTSLVQGGLLPRLWTVGNEEREWVVVTIKPDGNPLSHLCSALASWLSQDQARQAELAFQWEQEIRTSGGLSQLVCVVLDALRARRLLLVIDPGEDLLARPSQETRHFLQEVTSVAPLTVLFILRSNYYGWALEHPILGPLVPGRAVPMARMSRDRLKRTITELAAKGNLSLRPALVEELVEEVGQQPSGLSLLQRVLTELWIRRGKDSGLAFAEIGLVPGVARTLAEKALADSKEDEKVIRKLFLRLVHLDDTATRRLRVFWEEIDPVFTHLIEEFVESSVLVLGWDEHERRPCVELGYDDLVRGWQRLQQWITEERDFLLWRQRLRWRRREWEQGRHAPELLLLDRPSHEEARTWKARRPSDLVEVEKHYIETSEVEYHRRLELAAWHQVQEQMKKEREGRSRQLWRQAGVALVIATFGLFAFIWKTDRDRAQSRSAALAAEAARLADRKLDLALLLALQASKAKATAEARGVTLSLTAGNPALRFYLRPGPREQEAYPEEIVATAFGPGGLIATGGNGKVFLWDAKEGTLRRSLDAGSAEQIVSLAFSPDGSLLASGSKAAGYIHLWNLQNPEKPSELDLIRTDGSIQDLAFDREGRLLAWRTPSGTHIWDLSRGVLVWHLRRGPVLKHNWISGVAFGPSGVLAAARASGQITLWEPGKGERLLFAPGEGSTESVLGIQFLPQDGVLASAGSSFQRRSLIDGQPIGSPCSLLAGPGDEVLSVAFSRGSRFVASGHLDRKIRLWDVSTEGSCQLVTTLSGHSGFIWTLSFGPEKEGEPLTLISGGQGGDLILWQPDPKTSRFSIPLMNLSSESGANVATSADGGFVVVGDSQGKLTLFDGNSRAPLDMERTRYLSSIHHIVFRKDGLALATSGLEGTVHLWDVTHRNLQRLRDPLTVGLSAEDSIRSLAFGESSWIAAGTKDGHLAFWRFEEKGTPIWFLEKAHEGAIQSMTFVVEAPPLVRSLPPSIWPSLTKFISPFVWKPKEYLVTGGLDGSLSLWDPESRKRIQVIRYAHSESIEKVVAGAGGFVVSGSQDRNIRTWRMNRRLESEGILFLGLMISDLALSPEGDLLAAALGESSKSELVLWDLKARIPIGRGFQASGEIGSVAFGPSGESLYLAGKGISAWWDLRPATWSSRACYMVRRDFSPTEREKYLKPSEPSAVCRRK